MRIAALVGEALRSPSEEISPGTLARIGPYLRSVIHSTARPSTVPLRPERLQVSTATDPEELSADEFAECVVSGQASGTETLLSQERLRLSEVRIHGPSDPTESQADLAAARAVDMLHPPSRGSAPLVARRRTAGTAAAPGTAVPQSVAEVLASPGRPLDPGTQERMARTTGDDLSAVRIHDDGLAVRASADVHTAAWTVGNHIAFADGAFRPATPAGDRLLAHELAHVTQQRRTGLPMLARSVNDWLQSSRSVATMSYTDLVLEADDLQQWLNRQITSSPDTIRIEEALSEIRREVARRDAQAVSAGRPPARRPRRGTAAAPAPLPDRRPDVLTRMSSVAYTDPAEMRAQYDLIMQWLAVPQLAASERRILEVEQANLSVLLQGERQRAAGERQATRLALALTSAQADQGTQLSNLATVIEGIVADPATPELFWLYDRGERIPVSRAQRDSLRVTLHDQLAGAQQRLAGQVDYYWGRYQSQRGVNAEYPVVSAISGWLGGVRDPGAELARRRMAALGQLGVLGLYIKNGRLREAGAMLAGLEHDTQIIRAVARAFYEGYIEGAETAVTVLEITRDVSFAVAASIGAVVAAPFVAGVVAGTGATGTLATGLTIVGTGTVVGTGSGLVRGGSAALGVGLAGGTADEALAAFRSEGTRGFVDGFVAGAGGSAARALAPALASRLGGQVTARVATQMIVNSGATVIDSLVNGASIEQAARAGATAAVLSIPGGLVGGEGRVSRLLLGPLTSSGTAYFGAIANGATPDQARRAAITALATAFGTGGLVQGREDEVAGYYRAGQRFGAGARSTALQTTAAVMIGVAQAVPPVRTVGGATTTLTTSQPVSSEQVAVRATPTVPAAPAPGPVQVAPDVTPTTPVALPVTTPTAVAPATAQQVTAPTTATGGAAPVVSAATFATSVAPAVAAKPEPVDTEPVKTEPVKTEPVKTEPPKVADSPRVAEPAGETARTGQKAEGGGRVVAGRPVKPRTATATRYVWSNPRMSKGNFIEAELDADGALTITVKSHGPDELRVGGSQMLDDVFDHFGADKIREFDAKWVLNSSFRGNYDEYVQNLQKGMTPEDAAWNTWTGRQLKGRGFTSVEVPTHRENPDVVSPVFKK